MTAKRALAFLFCCLLLGNAAQAHRIDEYLQATLFSLHAGSVHASMRLIPGIVVAPSIIAAIDTNGDGILSAAEQRTYAEHVLADLTLSVDGTLVQPQLLSWSFPQPEQMRAGLGEIHIDYTAALPGNGTANNTDHRLIVTNHHQSAASVYLVNAEVPDDPSLHITSQNRNPQQTVYELDYRQTGTTPSQPLPSRLHRWLGQVQFFTLFHLGTRHIAEGTDHLLFLLTLLLPAPLLLAGRRWGGPATVRQSLFHVLSIVTAFTIGHSVTLSLAGLGAVHVPERPIEVLIAVSIFVSAMHALRPLVPGKEALIAGLFGLVHGLAFAATLDRLGMGHWERLAGILSFNLGIESMQMIVVAAVLPSLLLLSRTRAYPAFRISGAVFAGLASLGWIVERVFAVNTQTDTLVNALARHAPWIAAALFLFSLLRWVRDMPGRQMATRIMTPAGDPMPDTETLIAQAYAAFNRRDIDAALALMSDTVSWPRASEGGRATGKEEIRAYWTRQWADFDPHVEPIAMVHRSEGQTEVTVHQLVRTLTGDVLADGIVVHTFTVVGARIQRMDLAADAPAFGRN